MTPLLSILTPGMPSRWGQIRRLMAHVEDSSSNVGAVEHLTLLDNKRRTVGEKRDALLRIARGKFVAFVDDDDWIAPIYCTEIVSAIRGNPDASVVTFRQESTVNGETGLVEFRLGNPNEAFQPGGTTRRNAWHVCAWRRDLAILSSFPASNYGEDWAFASKLCALKDLREVHIPQVLHYYRHDAKTTLAPPGS